jgi:hypothetical protein
MIPDGKPLFESHLRCVVYHKVQVRRGFSILLVLIFSLGPLATLSAASEDASLPACCRRNGEHHCAMSMQGMADATAVADGAAPILKLPPRCPYFPQHAIVRNAPVYALTASSVGGLVLPVQPYRHSAGRAAPLLNPVSPLAGRGPPALNLD